MNRRLLLALICISFFKSYAQPVLLKNIIPDDAPASTYSSMVVTDRIKFHDKLFFQAISYETSREIFSSDGTEAGTSLFKEFYPGQKGVTSVSFGVTDNFMLFAVTGEDGSSLWRSDGTAGGTQKIASVKTYSNWRMTAFKGVLYFWGFDEEHGYEPWRSDGTTEGTYMIKDIRAGAESSVNGIMVAADEQIFFVANDGVNGLGTIWRTDGTSEGTLLVKDIDPSTDQYGFNDPVTVGNTGLFVLRNEVWKSDGTEAGTTRLLNTAQYEYIFSETPSIINNKLLIKIDTDATGYEMNAVDITTGDRVLLKDIYPGYLDGFGQSNTSKPILFNNKIWFLAQHGSNKFSLWSTDGTPEGTTSEFDLSGTYPNANDGWLAPVGNKLYSFFGSYIGGVLNVIEGTTKTLLATTWSATYLSDINGKLLFYVDGGTYSSEPWVSDGTVAGTKLLKDINSQKVFPGWTLRNAGDHVVFNASNVIDNTVYQDVWSTDGTGANTKVIGTFNDAFMGDVAVNGNNFLFQIRDNEYKARLQISNGTSGGTKLLKDGEWYDWYSTGQLRWVGNTAYIFTFEELWKTNGTAESTVKVKDLGFEFLRGHASFKGSLYFMYVSELWKSDGTDAGTVKVGRFLTNGGYRGDLIAGQNKMYFMATGNGFGMEVWVSDGTLEGTHVVKDVHPGAAADGHEPKIGAVVNDIVYFVHSELPMTNESTTNRELWRSDGTEAGTYQIKDIYPGPTGSNPVVIATSGNTVYFTANDGVHGYELWKTDGTEAGTVLIKDINPGKFSSVNSMVSPSQVIDGVLYFAASDGVHGGELWKSDGTEAGTVLVADVNPGMLAGMWIGTNAMASIGKQLIFIGNDGVHGFELMSYSTDKLSQTITFEPIADKTTDDAPFELVASSSSGLAVTFEVVSGPATISGTTLTITGSGTVTVRAIQSGNDEFSEASVEQSFNVILGTGLEDESGLVTVWPNPATNIIYVNAPATLIDMLGRTVVVTDRNQTSIDVGHLPRGMYIVKLQSPYKKNVVHKVTLR